MNGIKRTLPVSAAGNQRLLTLMKEHWTWDVIKKVIVGKRTKGTQWVESFNHVCAKFVAKYISVKDPKHYEAQINGAVMQFNDGYYTILRKLQSINLPTTEASIKTAKYLQRKRKQTALKASTPAAKRRRKERREKYLLESNQGEDEYCSGAFTKDDVERMDDNAHNKIKNN